MKTPEFIQLYKKPLLATAGIFLTATTVALTATVIVQDGMLHSIKNATDELGLTETIINHIHSKL